MHLKNNSEIIVIKGKVKFVFFDKDLKFVTEVILSDIMNKKLLIPNNSWYGFKNLSNDNSKILSITYPKFNEKNVLRKKLIEIKYNWKGD